MRRLLRNLGEYAPPPLTIRDAPPPPANRDALPPLTLPLLAPLTWLEREGA